MVIRECWRVDQQHNDRDEFVLTTTHTHTPTINQYHIQNAINIRVYAYIHASKRGASINRGNVVNVAPLCGDQFVFILKSMKHRATDLPGYPKICFWSARNMHVQKWPHNETALDYAVIFLSCSMRFLWVCGLWLIRQVITSECPTDVWSYCEIYTSFLVILDHTHPCDRAKHNGKVFGRYMCEKYWPLMDPYRIHTHTNVSAIALE